MNANNKCLCAKCSCVRPLLADDAEDDSVLRLMRASVALRAALLMYVADAAKLIYWRI
jgi:hypothetical protein